MLSLGQQVVFELQGTNLCIEVSNLLVTDAASGENRDVARALLRDSTAFIFTNAGARPCAAARPLHAQPRSFVSFTQARASMHSACAKLASSTPLSRRLLLSPATLLHPRAGNAPIKVTGQKGFATNQLFKSRALSFESLGIGGLDTQFENIFRRAFASRVFPPAILERLGIQHVKVGVGGRGAGRTGFGPTWGARCCRQGPGAPTACCVRKLTQHSVRSSIRMAEPGKLVTGSCLSPPSSPCPQGMLLYGPPGTGKTLIARQIGKMLNGKEPKVT